MNTTRRSLLSAVVAAPLLTVPAVAAAISTPSYAHAADLLARTTALRKRLNADVARSTEAEWAEWEQMQMEMVDTIEALPMTAEAARLRAKAIFEIYDDDEPFDPEQYETSDFRLVRQIMRTLAGEG